MFLYLTQPTLTAYLWSLKVYKTPSEGDGPGVKRSFSLAGSRLTAALDMDKMRWKTSPGVQSQERGTTFSRAVTALHRSAPPRTAHQQTPAGRRETRARRGETSRACRGSSNAGPSRPTRWDTRPSSAHGDTAPACYGASSHRPARAPRHSSREEGGGGRARVYTSASTKYTYTHVHHHAGLSHPFSSMAPPAWT